jgi:GntR family transcriptional regulator
LVSTSAIKRCGVSTVLTHCLTFDRVSSVSTRCATLPAMSESEKPFEHVAHELARRISVGEWKQGERLPSVRALSDEFDVAPGTVQRAIRILRQDGLIETAMGQGSRVARSSAARHDLDADVQLLKERVTLLEERLASSEVVIRKSKRPDAP